MQSLMIRKPITAKIAMDGYMQAALEACAEDVSRATRLMVADGIDLEDLQALKRMRTLAASVLARKALQTRLAGGR